MGRLSRKPRRPEPGNPVDLLASPLFLLTAIVSVSLLGISKGGFFGLGVMGIPLMSLVMHPLQAAAILLPTTVAQDVLTIWTYRRNWSASNLKVLVPSMSIGVAAGWWLAASFSAAHVRLLVGVIAALFVLRHWLGPRFERWTPRPSTATGVVFGALGGFTTLLANAGGPAWQMHLLPQGLDKLTYVGTVTMLFGISNVFKVPAFGSLGLLTWENIAVGLMLVPLAVGTNYLGIWLVRRTPTETFFRIAYVLMLVIAVELIRGGLAEILRG
jgi:uncharacterized membrane protein YfcA